MKDKSFDGLAKKFSNNIYGTTKGKLRHQLLCDAISENMQGEGPQRIIDLGGGTGVMANYLARQGHEVTLADASEEILSVARDSVSPDISIVHDDLYNIQNIASFDLVVCHAVLEWLATPEKAICHLAQVMRSGAQLSLTVFNHDAALFGNAVYGNFDYIAQGMKIKNQVRLTPQQQIKPQQVLAWVREAGLNIVSKRGIRCFHDYLRNIDHAQTQYEQLYQLEQQYNTQEPFLWLGKYFHLWITKP